MLDALTAKATAAATAVASAASGGAAPDALTVIDTSDSSADLAWIPVAGATVYRVSRAGADGVFAAIGNVAGPSFGDSGLAPQTTFRWHVSAVVNGVEGPVSVEVAATTRSTPAPCDRPGTCPVGK
jgi:poly(3-hydroxybutyrate) depolymerase